jgi:hypothetical protein
MKITINNRLPWVSLTLLVLLLVFAPYAMSFRPYPPYTGANERQRMARKPRHHLFSSGVRLRQVLISTPSLQRTS